jgi:fructose-bisphosphate aldolase class II
MTSATLSDVLQPALAEGYAVAGLVCLGWDDAVTFLRAAEEIGHPVILQAGPGARRAIPLPVWGKMLRPLADAASVPVVVHLDHGASLEECRAAIGEGFTSVMYDGSRDPLDKNIADTAAVAELAHAAGVSCEGEIGFVGYSGGETSHGTDPDEAARFARETKVDAMAVSVGNVHLKEDGAVALDWDRLATIGRATAVPLVIHGGSGVARPDRARLVQETPVCKINIGTELRQAYGHALRTVLQDDPALFDRLAIAARVSDMLRPTVHAVLRGLAPGL